ncbi:MAG: hypothetical protein ACK5MQ_14900 [Pikeienuella sp.]
MGRAALLGVIVASLVLRWTGWVSPFVFDLVFAALVAFGVCSMLRRLRAPAAAILGVGVLAPAACVAAMLADPDIRLSPYLAVALINGLVGYAFSRGLRDGRRGLIPQIIALMGIGPVGGADWRRYVRSQNRAWTIFGAVTCATALLAMLAPALRHVLDSALLVEAGFQVLWFVLSHQYAQWRHGRPESWRDTIRWLTQPATLRKLEL